MRIRRYRPGDIPTLAHIQQRAAEADGVSPLSEADFEQWFSQPELQAESNVFLITDDDDDLNEWGNEWGQAGTLDGLEGEAVGYTVLQLRRSHHAYHFLCEGTVLPEHRRRGAGYSLLISALNNVRMRIFEFEFEARQQEHAIYFEALLPANDPASPNLAALCELAPVDGQTLPGMRLYRCEL
ncbi:MAG TPA: GNAT family N-acetyltransferase [Ktedonobacteraceae bacterium]|nr:GNAT family N-acetyltransferase [Ktedonobacteraceae bacterium]